MKVGANKERRYVLILDKVRGYIRIFRSDCPVRPAGKVLWEGDGLRKTYDAMKRLNKERRPVVIYYVFLERTNNRIKVSKTPSDNNSIISKHLAYKEAVTRAKFERKKHENIFLQRLEKVGVITNKIPKLTSKDLEYLKWFEKKNEIIQEAA